MGLDFWSLASFAAGVLEVSGLELQSCIVWQVDANNQLTPQPEMAAAQK